MFELEIIEQKNAENKTIYIASLVEKRLKFTNKMILLEYFKDLNNFFKEYFFVLETFYHRIKSFDLLLSQNSCYGHTTARLFFNVETMRSNVFVMRQQKKTPAEVSRILNGFCADMMQLTFTASKHNLKEAEQIYHLLTDLRVKFFSVLDNSFELHKNKSLKLFI